MSLKDAKVNFLVDMATDLFMSRSIQEVTIRDIAVSAQVGEATIYRYFGKKQTLVVQAAMKLQQAVNADYFKLDQGKNGFEKIEAKYYRYFLEEKDYYESVSVYFDEEPNVQVRVLDGSEFRGRIKYVHQLQQASRLCNIRKEIEL